MLFSEEMLGEGLEPTLLAEPDPKSGASANFATRASGNARRKLPGNVLSFPVKFPQC